MNKPDNSATPEQSDQAKQRELLEKFDKESVTRTPKQKSVALFITVLAICYSLFHLFITYNPLPELIQRSAHASIGLALKLVWPKF